MKRFTDTQKWEDSWYRKLDPATKLFWQWACDKCDQAGVFDPDYELASFQIGGTVTEETISALGDRIERLPNGKLFIPKFVRFQYGKLSRASKPHMPVYAALERHGIDETGVIQNLTYKNTVDEYMRRKVIARDGLRCVYYDIEITAEEAVIDHIHPRVKGGTATMDNLVVSSSSANSKKWDRSVHQFCISENLDVEAVFRRLSMATGKPIIAFQDSDKPFHRLQGSLKEEEEEEDKEKEQEKVKEEGEVSYPEIIESLWSMFPPMSRTRSSKKLLQGEWNRARPKPTPEKVIESLAKWALCLDWTRDGGRFAQGAHLWIKARKWESEPTVGKQTTFAAQLESDPNDIPS